jgi:hypothetical protein
MRILNLDLNAPTSIDPIRSIDRPALGSWPSRPGSYGESRRIGAAHDDSSSLPDLGVDGKRIRVTTRIEDFARQVHREGLPFARVWENQSMLVSVGLNPKGRPGLWIIQKVP